MANINIWNEGPIHDLGAWVGIDEYNVFLFKVPNWPDYIEPNNIQIGDWHFIIGNEYTRIGHQHKTSAGYTWFHGKEPIIYMGMYKQYLLFKRKGREVQTVDEYTALLTCFQNISNICLFTTNHCNAGRIIECMGNIKTRQLQLWTNI